MFLLTPKRIDFWSPPLYVLSTTTCGNEFHHFIMIFVESIVSWVSCFKLANCSFYWDCFLCYEIQWKNILYSLFQYCWWFFWGFFTILSLVCPSSNMKILKPFFFSPSIEAITYLWSSCHPFLYPSIAILSFLRWADCNCIQYWKC